MESAQSERPLQGDHRDVPAQGTVRDKQLSV